MVRRVGGENEHDMQESMSTLSVPQRTASKRKTPPLRSKIDRTSSASKTRRGGVPHYKLEQTLFRQHLLVLLLCLFFQYFHAVATNVAFYLHIPREPLWDLGFVLLPIWRIKVSRIILYCILTFTAFFIASPFYFNSRWYRDRRRRAKQRRLDEETSNQLDRLTATMPESVLPNPGTGAVHGMGDNTRRGGSGRGDDDDDSIVVDWNWAALKHWLRTSNASRRQYAVIMLLRFASTGVLAQCLRIITFLVTTLPGPNPHCRPDSPYYNPPRTLTDILLHRTYSMAGCGDLVFSSHALLATLCALTYSHYGTSHILKVVLWIAVFFHGLATVAAREHYMLDVFIAWYTVPLVWVVYEWFFPDKLPGSFAPYHFRSRYRKRNSSIALEDDDTSDDDESTFLMNSGDVSSSAMYTDDFSSSAMSDIDLRDIESNKTPPRMNQAQDTNNTQSQAITSFDIMTSRTRSPAPPLNVVPEEKEDL